MLLQLSPAPKILDNMLKLKPCLLRLLTLLAFSAALLTGSFMPIHQAYSQTTSQTSSPDPQFPNSFQAGLKMYRSKDYQQAKVLFKVALAEQPNNAKILYNLGLAHYQLAERGYSLGYWRRALYLSPLFSLPRAALVTAQSEIGTNLNWRSSYLLDLLRNYILSFTDIEVLWFLTSFLFALSALKIIPFFSKRNHLSDQETRPFVWSQLSVLIVCIFSISLFLSLTKTFEHYNPRATVIVSLLPVNLAPHKDDNTLFELSEGFEVQVKKLYDDWVQITSHKGLTGWAPKAALLQTTGHPLW